MPDNLQPRRQFLGRAAVRVFDRARAGREDHGQADAERAGEDGSGGGRAVGSALRALAHPTLAIFLSAYCFNFDT